MSIKDRKYSIRDFRTGRHSKISIERRFGGEYEAASRRWFFPSAAQRNEFAQELRADAEQVPLHLPGASEYVGIAKRFEGYFIFARSTDELKARERDTIARTAVRRHNNPNVMIFPDRELRDEARFAYLEVLRPTPEDRKAALAALKSIEPRHFGPQCDDLQIRLANDLAFAFEAQGIVARAAAVGQFTPPSKAADGKSAADAIAQTNNVIQSVLNLEAEFEPLPYRPVGRLRGVVVGRSEYHLAILTHDDGRGVLVPRADLQFDLRRDGKSELSCNRGAAIVIDYDQHGYGRAYQDTFRIGQSMNYDLELGPMLIEATIAAGDLRPALEYDLEVERAGHNIDIDGRIVSIGQETSAILDAGAAIAFIPNSDIGALVPGARVARGPSFKRPASPVLSRSASR